MKTVEEIAKDVFKAVMKVDMYDKLGEDGVIHLSGVKKAFFRTIATHVRKMMIEARIEELEFMKLESLIKGGMVYSERIAELQGMKKNQ